MQWVIQMTKSENYVILKTTTVQQFVEHPEFGKGKPILKSHAIPDDNGYVEWYDVQFKHGIEEKVMAKDMVMKIMQWSSRRMEEPMTKNGMITQ